MAVRGTIGANTDAGLGTSLRERLKMVARHGEPAYRGSGIIVSTTAALEARWT